MVVDDLEDIQKGDQRKEDHDEQVGLYYPLSSNEAYQRKSMVRFLSLSKELEELKRRVASDMATFPCVCNTLCLIKHYCASVSKL